MSDLEEFKDALPQDLELSLDEMNVEETVTDNAMSDIAIADGVEESLDIPDIAMEESLDLTGIAETETVLEDSAQEQTAAQPEALFDENDLPSEEVSEIAKGTSITGNIESDGSVYVYGKLKGDITCKGKLIATDRITGTLRAREIFSNNAKIEGDIHSSGIVKIGNGSVIVGNIYATSAVIGGAVKGDIDVPGPVIIDGTAIIQGNINSRSVQINNGAVIEGFCSQGYAEVASKTLFEDTFSEM